MEKMVGKFRDKNSTCRRLALTIVFFICICLVVAMIVRIFFSWRAHEESNKAPTSTDADELLLTSLNRNVDLGSPPVSFNCDREEFDAKSEIVELVRIKRSVLNELRLLEEKRNVLRTEISILLTQSERLQGELQQGVKDLEKVVASIEQAKAVHRETVERNMPEIYLPSKVNLLGTDVELATEQGTTCSTDTCFDFSHCSLIKGFTFAAVGLDKFQRSLFKNDDHKLGPCVTFVNASSGEFDGLLTGNAVFVQFDSEGSIERLNSEILERSVVAASNFGNLTFRPKFDVVIPPKLESEAEDGMLPQIVPARRRYLLHFIENIWKKEDLSTKTLKMMLKTKTDDKFDVEFGCETAKRRKEEETRGKYMEEVTLCGSEKSRGERLKAATFSLIIGSSEVNNLVRFVEGLKYGAIPVVLGNFPLPFDEFVDWRRAAVILPLARISELHFLLRTFGDEDVLELRRNGRRLYETYLSSEQKVFDTLVALIRNRLLFPAVPVDGYKGETYFNETNQPILAETTQTNPLDVEEYLGPVELPYPSPKYQQNFSMTAVHTYDVWNIRANPFELHDCNPFRGPMPSEAKFEGSQFGYRPINGGVGGSGKEFAEALGGNFVREQFTVVLLTYEREAVLIAALARLAHLPYLNKIIVVWNGPTPPNPETVWPKMSAPFMVVKPQKNSLNNRFLNFDAIETEAVLSMDDDVHLRHDEIVFGFRVWREARDRIVGFPGRFHGWDAKTRQWVYNSNHSCELSMVLTGAAFVHKYYLHMYSNEMPKLIRNKVDDLMNCEDIAMNFLVSHVTRKPPIKVTSRWTFRCPGCPETLSADESHFNERHECINYFARIYGYNPLLYTQFRVDSVLFKTKIPQNHQKCFKFI